MNKLTSRTKQNEHSGEAGVFAPQSKYQPIHLSAQWVFDHASILTQQQMADMFSIDRNTLMDHFADAYRAGKAARPMKRRKQLEDVIDQLAQTAEYNHTHPEAKTGDFLKAMTLWMKRYDGLDKPVIEDDATTGDAGDAREIRVVRPTKDDM